MKVVQLPIAIYSAVFDYLMQRVTKQKTGEQDECDLLLIEQAEDNYGSNVQKDDRVYYRFGGATLAAPKVQATQIRTQIKERVCQSPDKGTEGNTVH